MSSPYTAIQATEHVIRLLEQAKAHSETALDLLPGLFIVIGENGEILRNNFEFANVIGRSKETVCIENIYKFFDAQNQLVLKEHLRRSDDGNSRDFEVQMQLPKGIRKDYIFSILPWKRGVVGDKKFYTLLGRDVTALKETIVQKARMEFELESAQLMQKQLMPSDGIVHKHFKLSSKYRPATECSGDFLYYNHIEKQNRLWIWMGDVIGHGLASAMIASGVRSTVAVLEENEHLTPKEALRTINETMIKTVPDQTMTFAAFMIDLKSLVCKVSLGGHPDPMFLRFDQGGLQARKLVFSSSPLLGSETAAAYPEWEIQLQKGDLLFGYTDGLIEMINSERRMLRPQGLLRWLKKLVGKDSEPVEIVTSLEQKVDEFLGGLPPGDDIAYFCLQV